MPDAIFGLEYDRGSKNAYRFFAVEIDRGTMPVTRSDPRQTCLRAKFSAYGEIIRHNLQKQHLGIPNLLVLTVTPDARIEQLLPLLADQPMRAAFLFQGVDRAAVFYSPAHWLLDTSWRRSELPTLNIVESAGDVTSLRN